MKTKVTTLLVVLIISTISCTAQRTITVQAQNNDISNNLDLQAVASTFGESKDLEDFERRLNDYDSQLSNLDLNNDGEVDYLRVIENNENNVHLVVIQAVLGRDIFQDVATIVVEKRENRRTMVQVIGDPYIYGNDYIIEPVYVYTPSIFSFFWGYNYRSWYSPYYYGYYPQYYRPYHPYESSFYLSHIGSHINHNHRYFYNNRYHNEYSERLHESMRRNDYGSRHPENNFSNRNSNISSKREIDNKRENNTVFDRTGSRSDRMNNNSGNRNTESRTSTPAATRTHEDVYQNRTVRPDNSGNRSNGNWQNGGGSRTERSTSTPTRTAPTPQVNRNSENNSHQQRPTTQSRPDVVRPQQPTISRESNSRPAPVVTQPSRQSETRSVERKPAESTPRNENNSDRGSRNNNERR